MEKTKIKFINNRRINSGNVAALLCAFYEGRLLRRKKKGECLLYGELYLLALFGETPVLFLQQAGTKSRSDRGSRFNVLQNGVAVEARPYIRSGLEKSSIVILCFYQASK